MVYYWHSHSFVFQTILILISCSNETVKKVKSDHLPTLHFKTLCARKTADSQCLGTINAHFQPAYVQFLNIYFSNAYKHDLAEAAIFFKQDKESNLRSLFSRNILCVVIDLMM